MVGVGFISDMHDRRLLGLIGVTRSLIEVTGGLIGHRSDQKFDKSDRRFHSVVTGGLNLDVT